MNLNKDPLAGLKSDELMLSMAFIANKMMSITCESLTHKTASAAKPIVIPLM